MLTAWSLIAVLLAGLVAYLRPVQRPPLVPLRHEDKQDAPQRRSRRCLLVTAHPDDECMFFSPAILHLRRLGVEVVILCLSRGNFDGLGETREKELLKNWALWALEWSIQLTWLSVGAHRKLQDGPHVWNPVIVSNRIEDFVKSSTPLDMILTFDKYGVSGHLNHISAYQGVKLFLARHPDSHIHALSLSSVPLTRKYLFFVDILFTEIDQWLLSGLKSQRVVVSDWKDYLKARKAMVAHQSQLVWFRHLYITFSRYMFINHFEPIQVQVKKEEVK